MLHDEMISLSTDWDCPKSLLDFAENAMRRNLDVKPWNFDFTLDDFVAKFVGDLLGQGRNQCKSEKEYRKWISGSIKSLSDSFKHNPELGRRVVCGECTAIDVIEEHTRYRRRNKRMFEEITSHHSNLKVAGWVEGIEKETDLRTYAKAANEMGQKPWVLQANQWMETCVIDYFRNGGGKKSIIKSLKRKRVQEYKTFSGPTEPNSISEPDCEPDFSPEFTSRLEQMTRTLTEVLPDDICSIGDNRKIRLVDVGSCYNFFVKSPNHSSFDVTALDLQPVDSTVYKCDFLDLVVGNSVRKAPVPLASYSALTELPAESFDAVTMSLVLSYLPTPEHRRRMVAKARALLVTPPVQHIEDVCTVDKANSDIGTSAIHYPGVFVIAEKASIFGICTGKSDAGLPNSHTSLRRGWISAICREGFELLQYKDMVMAGHHVHVFAFKAVSPAIFDGCSSVSDCAGPQMRIKNDTA